MAAGAATVAGLVVVSPFGATEPSAATLVRNAAVASQEALASGRAALTVEQDGYKDTYEYAFAGDDVSVEIGLASTSATASGERRIVDGELYWHVGDDPARPWFHQTGGRESRSDLGGDPRSLLAGLAPNAGFDYVGDDTVDGQAVSRLRATTPENVDAGELSLGEATMSDGAVTDLEVWIDSHDVVRRIDLTTTQTFDLMTGEALGQPGDGPVDFGAFERETMTQVITASVRFTDIGVSNTIEVPQNLRDVSVEELANPGPPPGSD